MRAVAVTLLVLAAGALVLWLSRGNDAPALATEDLAKGFAPAAVSSPTSASVRDEASEVAAAERVDTGASTALGPPPIPDDAPWATLRVVDDETGAPVPHADVRWSDPTCSARVAALPEREQRRYWSDADLLIRTFGWHTHADARGLACVHVHRHTTFVEASASARYGTLGLFRRERELRAEAIELRIERDFDAVVRVVEAARRPVGGVAVTLEPEAGTGALGTTDADGVVRHRHFQLQLARGERGRRLEQKVRASVRDPGVECSVTVPVTAAGVTAELVLPPTGAVSVRVLHPGRSVESVVAEMWDASLAVSQGSRETVTNEPGDDGVIRFPVVALGLTLSLRVRIGELELARDVVGPTVAGEAVEVVMEVPASAVALTGRLVAADGAPLANVKAILVECRVHRAGSQASRSEPVVTDAGGRFVLHLAAEPRSGPIELQRFAVELQRSELELAAGCVPPRSLTPGVNDLGDVRLVPEPVLVAGRARFDRAPVHAYVPLRVERWRPGEGDGGAWQEEGGVRVLQDHAGRFAVLGDPPPGRLRLDFAPHGGALEFHRGTEGLAVELARGTR